MVSTRTKHVAVVILTQIACLAVGLWMQHRFAGAASREDANQQAWTELHDAALRLVPLVADVTGGFFAGRVEGPTPIDRILSAASPPGGGAMLADSRWRVLAQPADGRRETSHWARGDQLAWSPRSEGEKPDAAQAGFISAGSVRHLAVAHPLPGANAYLVLHRSQSSVAEATAAAFVSVGGIAVLTWLWTAVLLGITSYMALARFHDDAERERARTVYEQLQQRQKLLRTRDAVIFGLAKLADSRDPETGDHLERISVYSTTLASMLRNHPAYAHEATLPFIRLIGISSALHDIGKVGIEDRILLKPGPLTEAERTRIQQHAVIGGQCLREIEQRLGSTNFLQMAREIAFAHHERWDGTGYPNGLKGEKIPLSARIVAIADVYDALSSRRVYKGPHAHEECVEIIRRAAGTQFDPQLVAVWLTIEGKFREIAERYRSTGSPSDVRAEAPSAPEVEFDTDSGSLVASAP